MRYHNITKEDMLNGEGLRVVLWVAGCEHHCENCQNPVTWDKDGGIDFDESAKQEIFTELDKPHIQGITLSGGDPLATYNRKDITKFVKEIRDRYKNTKDIWVYTGYNWSNVSHLSVMKNIDILIDGKFKSELKDNDLHWMGSSNQDIIDVQKSLLEHHKIIYKEPS